MVTIVACTIRNSYMNNVFRNFERQQWKDKEMIIVLNNDDMDLKTWKKRARQYGKNTVRVYKLPQSYKLGRCLNYAIARAKEGIIAKFDDDDYYAPNYLRESIQALNSKKGSIVGKSAAYLYFEEKQALMVFRPNSENERATTVKGGTLMFNKSLWRQIKFTPNRPAGTDSVWIRTCRRRGIPIYSVSKKNYVCVRRRNTNSHTQKQDTKTYMAHCKLVRYTKNYIPYIS